MKAHKILDRVVVDAIPKPNRTMAPFWWFGGKGMVAKKIVRLFPRRGVRVYIEPYAGAASLLWHLPEPYPIEVLNDIDERIVNLFRVLQSKENFEELAHRLIWTPYSRSEFVKALSVLREWDAHDPITRAWAFFVAQNQGFSGEATHAGNWGRALTFVRRGMAGPPSKWRGRLRLLALWHERLTRVQIEKRDALEVIRYWDTPETLFYVDPPYVSETRKGGGYQYEADNAHHEALVEALLGVRGFVVLSGYDHPLYRPLIDAGWKRYTWETVAHAAGRVRGSGLQGEGAARRKAKRVECVLVNFTINAVGEPVRVDNAGA